MRVDGAARIKCVSAGETDVTQNVLPVGDSDSVHRPAVRRTLSAGSVLRKVGPGGASVAALCSRFCWPAKSRSLRSASYAPYSGRDAGFVSPSVSVEANEDDRDNYQRYKMETE